MKIQMAQFLIALMLLSPAGVFPASVTLERVPEKGLQPQLAVASDGTLHLIYLSDSPKAADIHYVHRAADAKEWSATVRVNSQTGSAIAMGTIRGAQLALGRNGFVHVAWNGS